MHGVLFLGSCREGQDPSVGGFPLASFAGQPPRGVGDAAPYGVADDKRRGIVFGSSAG